MERFELLYDISRRLSSSLDLDKVLRDILALTIPSVGARPASFQKETSLRSALWQRSPR